MTRVKVCGVTRRDQAEQLARLGVYAVGLNFVPGGRRAVALDTARAIHSDLSGRTLLVGVFVDPDPAWVEQVLAVCDLDVLQFHGAEQAAACTAYGKPYIKALAMRSPETAAEAEQAHPEAQALLLDAHVDGLAGGTGHRFDWGWWPTGLAKPLFLAGGLDPLNVGGAVEALRPYGVDVASGVEGEEPGVKDMGRVQQFIDQVQQADAHERQ